jgi:uncharacterized protein
MTPQEQDLIQALLARLQQAANQPKDRDAEELIRRAVAAQPDAPYLLVQTVLIEDMALNEAHGRIKELEQQLAAAKSAAPAQPTSFLGGALRASVPTAGPWGRPAAPAPAWSQPGGQPAAAPSLASPASSGGFLRQAATTAAGIAGGALLFEGISSLFGPHYGNVLAGMPAQPGLGETVTNNYYNTPAPDTTQADDDTTGGGDPGLTQADNSQDTGGQDYASDQDYGGGDSGGGVDV